VKPPFRLTCLVVHSAFLFSGYRGPEISAQFMASRFFSSSFVAYNWVELHVGRLDVQSSMSRYNLTTIENLLTYTGTAAAAANILERDDSVRAEKLSLGLGREKRWLGLELVALLRVSHPPGWGRVRAIGLTEIAGLDIDGWILAITCN